MKTTKAGYRGNTAQCKKCLYRISDGGTAFCGYMYYTGQRRPCEPSPNCTAFEKYRKKEKQKLESKLHSLSGYWLGGLK